jgi:branched-chain amino acid aminotransferase
MAWSWDKYLGDKLLKVKLSPYQRPNPKSVNVAAKVCGHYTNSLLATADAKQSGFDEALLFDMKGFVAEGPGANFFFQKDEQLYTPKTGNILPGITRNTVMELCNKIGICFVEKDISKEELFEADAAFFCGTAAEIAGIKQVNEYVFPLQWDKSYGSVLQKAYSELVHKKQFQNQPA